MPYKDCLGGCGRTIGVGCGCCSPDFPEEYGYCSECFEKSDDYRDRMMALKGILDRIDGPTHALLVDFLENFDHEFENYYKEEVNLRKNDYV